MKRSILFILLVSVYCTKEEPQIQLNPNQLFLDVEKTLAEEAYFYSPEKLPQMYTTACKAIAAESDDCDRSSLISRLESDQQSKTVRTMIALRSFLANAGGENGASLKVRAEEEQLAGIGLVLREVNGTFVGMDSLPNSPASRGNVPLGIPLKTVDGKSVKDLGLSEVVNMIKGKPETEVRVGFEKEYIVQRSVLQLVPIETTTITPENGEKVEWITIHATISGVSGLLRQKVLGAGNRSALVIDLRKLGIGDLDEGMRIADLFVGKGKLGSVKRKKEEPTIFEGDPDQIYSGRIFVVIGKYSSGVAEAMASTLASSKNVTLVGVSTPGNTYVAKEFPLDNVTVSLTIGAFYNSKDEGLFEEGLSPKINADDVLPQNADKETLKQDSAFLKIADSLNLEFK